MTTKQFHLGDILSITTGRLMSPQGMGGVYEILNWMTGESVFTHQIPRIAKEAAPVILRALPQIANAQCDDVTAENFDQRLSDLVVEFGEMHPVPKMTIAEHERIDPISEAAEMFHPDKIIAVSL